MEPLLSAIHGHGAQGTVSPESKPSSPSADGKPKLRVVERGSQACNECRRHKIRCHPAPDDPEHIKPCARCVRMSLECVFKKHNRGRKRKNPPPTDAQEMLLAPAKQPHLDSNGGPGMGAGAGVGGGRLPPPSGFWNRGSPDRTLFNSAARYPFMALEPPSRDEPEHAAPAPGQQHPVRPALPTSMSLRSMVNSEPWEQDEEYTDSDELDDRSAERERHPDNDRDTYRSIPPSAAAPVANGGGSQNHAGDPVSLGFLTLEEAKVLFTLFMKHFNIAMPLLDPATHTHDFVRHHSPFLYTVVLCIASRYMSALGHEPMSLSANSAHQQIVILARDHLMWAFAEAVSTVDVVQAIAALCLWKEPDDDKAAFYFNRAVILARELDLGRDPPASEVARMTTSEKRDLRFKQRLWLSLFSTNSIFHMQFRQPMLISYTDSLVLTSTLWLKHASPDQVLMDTFCAFSVDLRRRFLHYRSLLTDGQPSALTLSVLTKTMNKEWEVTSEAWIREIIDAGGTPTYVHKPRVWYSSLGLNLNLIILNQTLRIPPMERIPPTAPALGRGSAVQLRSIPAFHYCLNAASTVLLRFHDLDKAQLTYASDTLLHFALYAATFLWSLCRTPDLYDFETAEVEYTRDLILKVASTLDEASAYPHSSPALHAKYLRRLCRSGPSSEAPGSVSGASDSHPLSHGRNQNYSETERTQIDPALMGQSAHGLPLSATQAHFTDSHAPGGELDFILNDFQWAGIELPWTGVDPALLAAAQASAAAPPSNGRYPASQIV